MRRILASTLLGLSTIFCAGVGCGSQGADVAEPEEISLDDGIPSPEAGMPGSMKEGATQPPKIDGGNAPKTP